MIGHSTGTLRRAIAWAFRDRHTGAITIAQRPNLSLWLFIVLAVLAAAAEGAGLRAGWLRIAAHLTLAWWAADEVLRGVNPWRRFLGAATLAGLGVFLLWATAP